jgi:hypothetical protein
LGAKRQQLKKHKTGGKRKKNGCRIRKIMFLKGVVGVQWPVPQDLRGRKLIKTRI